MGLQDRDYGRSSGDYGEGGGFRRAMKRVFFEGDDFFGWSFKLFRMPHWFPGLRDIEVRIHLFFVIFVVAELIWSLKQDSIGFRLKAFELGWLWVLVLLHEFGHCFACRAVGGEADRVLLWPLGGLAMCRPPRNWRANLITILGGPGVNLVLIPVLGAALLAVHAGWGSLIYNPFSPYSVWKSQAWFTTDTSYWRYFLWIGYNVNLLLFAFNMLLVMFPMDAGQILQSLLWAKLGYRRSMLIATNVGLVMAVVVGVYALLIADQKLLAGIALFAGITCFNQRRMLSMMGEDAEWAYDTDRGYQGLNAASPSANPAEDKAYKAALKKQQKERELQSEVDRILDKIREKGMQSLSGKEKAILKDATERGRGQG